MQGANQENIDQALSSSIHAGSACDPTGGLPGGYRGARQKQQERVNPGPGYGSAGDGESG
jgi:hypothetical protein